MSDGLNRATLLGNLGADPEFRATQSGTGVLRLRVATTSSWFDKSKDERQERTDWHDVVLFGQRAEALERVLGKGDRIYVEGELRTSSYEKDGEKRYRTEIHAQNIVLCGGARGGGEGRARDDYGSRPAPRQQAPRDDRGGRRGRGDDRRDDRRGGRSDDRAPARAPAPADDDWAHDAADDDIPF